jgi:uracil permease
MNTDLIPVNKVPPLSLLIPLSIQHLFAMFGATVLVPVLLGINPATILLFNGIGTLIFLIICQWKVPAYLGSSFAYIAPSLLIIGSYGYGAALSGYIFTGFFFLISALIIYRFGTNWVRILFPDVVMGSVVAVIGLALAPTASKMSGLSIENTDYNIIAISLFTLLVTLICMTVFKGFLRVIPVLIGIISGSALAIFLGYFSYDKVIEAPWLAFPPIYTPVWSIHAIIILIPAFFVTLVVLIGHLQVTGSIIGTDMMKDPGLFRVVVGKGIACTISGFFGSTPNTTYSENIGVMAITGVYSTAVFAGTAILAILISFCGKFSSAIMSIPDPVIGGISLLLFGVIAAQGIRMLIDAKVDLNKTKNMVLVSVILVIGCSDAVLKLGPYNMEGMSLATIIGLLLNLCFIALSKYGIMND